VLSADKLKLKIDPDVLQFLLLQSCYMKAIISKGFRSVAQGGTGCAGWLIRNTLLA